MNKSYAKVIKHLMYKISKVWSIGQKIDNINTISIITHTSYYNAKKAVEYMCKKGYIDNRGTDGLWLINKPNSLSSTLKRITVFNNYVKCANLIMDGGFFDKKSSSVIRKHNDIVKFYFPYIGKEKIININTIIDLIKNPLEAHNINSNDKNSLEKYLSQQKAKEIFDIAIRNRKKIGINLNYVK